MKPMTERLPKALIPVNGTPFADYQLEGLARQGVERVVFSVGHLGAMIRDFVGDGSRWGLKAACVDEGHTLLGTAGAIRLAIDEGLMDEVFLVLYGDSYLPIELSPVWRACAAEPLATMCVLRNQGRWDSSNVIFKDGRVTLYEKGRADAAAIGMEYIDYGLSVMRRDVIAQRVSSGEKAGLADVFHDLSVDGKLRGHQVHDRFYEIGSPQGLSDLEAYLGGRQ